MTLIKKLVSQLTESDLCKFHFEDNKDSQFKVINKDFLNTSEVILKYKYLDGTESLQILPFDDQVWVIVDNQ